jgi:acyl-coenzyme A synthetase/AMP-(fatty) acid ligase
MLLTSGTLGVPKMMVHTIDSLTATAKIGPDPSKSTVWGSFYDIWRFAGLQVFFQAMLGGGSLVLASREEPLPDYLARIAACRGTHLSGTPTQWRRVLMSPWLQKLAPRQVTLGGEIVDQAILNNLRRLFPDARVTHIYASTEAGVGFAVNDGLAGFPAAMLGRRSDGTELRVENGTLYIRSGRLTRRSIERDRPAPIGEDGFVDTGDMVEWRGDRCVFLGRRDGVINVGGVKVHPEEVEAVINSHPAVRYSRVRARRNPITGAIVVAEIVLKDGVETDETRQTELRRDIRQLCRQELTQYQVPATISIVADLKVGVGGKLVRHDA